VSQENPTDQTVKYTFYNLHNQDYEYENELNVSAFHVGSLNKQFLFWKDTIKANNFALNVISSGYFIPFYKTPTSVNLRNNGSAFKHSSFVEQAINKLLESGAAIECTNILPYVINPLTVSVNHKDKERLILDLCHVNQYIEKRKHKFEGVSEAIQYIIKDRYVFKFDLSSGYHNVSIHKDHQKYLGFSWKFKNTVKYFMFCTLPFGLSSAGHVFSKVLRPMVKYWQPQGHRIILYLDDGWGIESNFNICKAFADRVRQELESAGFFINKEKSVWEPSRRLTWLGFIWDLNTFSLEKITRFKNDIILAMSELSVLTARRLAKITGKIISLIPSYGNICRIMCRNMLMIIATSRYWDEIINMNDDAKVEIKFGLYNCQSLPQKRFFAKNLLPDKIVYTDASSFACAGFTVETYTRVVHKMWSSKEALKSSTYTSYRELKAVFIMLFSLQEVFQNRLVKS
jgi:hypothetical protein